MWSEKQDRFYNLQYSLHETLFTCKEIVICVNVKQTKYPNKGDGPQHSALHSITFPICRTSLMFYVLHYQFQLQICLKCKFHSITELENSSLSNYELICLGQICCAAMAIRNPFKLKKLYVSHLETLPWSDISFCMLKYWMVLSKQRCLGGLYILHSCATFCL